MKTKLYLFIAGLLLAAIATGLGQPCIIITTQPQNQTPCFGTTATFTVAATGAEPLSYQWQQSFDGTTFADRPDSTNATLQITNVQGLDMGTYRVTITNAECAVTSAVATLYVDFVRAFDSDLRPAHQLAFGEPGCEPDQSGYRPAGRCLTYQWRLNGEPLPGQTKNSPSS